jgi:hypothetical protein
MKEADMMNDDSLSEAIQLIRTGKKADAQLILEPYILANPQNIQAWMWEAEIFPDDSDKIKVLEICLEHNPGHPQVSQALKLLRTRAGVFSVPEPATAPPVNIPEVLPPIAPAPILEKPPVVAQVSSPAQKPAVRETSREPAIEHKHPDWPTVNGLVDFSEIRVIYVRRIPTYYAEIDAMYVVQNKDYRVKFAHAKKTSLSPFDAEILTSTYTTGKGITVSYNPRNPAKAWVHEWDPRVVKRGLRKFKDRPDIREAISRRYKSRMMNGFWLTLGGIAATIIMSLIFSELGGAYVLFYGVIIIGIFYFLSGLIGWLWNMD